MSDKTSIEWTQATWNPVRGCSRISPGCGGPNHQGGCYAEKIAARFSDPGQPFHGFAERSAHGGRWTGKMALVDDMLTLPLRWKKPRRIFVNSMSDLFHEALPDEAIDKVFAVMALAPQHIYQVLTKRADRMRRYFERHSHNEVELAAERIRPSVGKPFSPKHVLPWPLPNVWLGVSVEDQERAGERIPDLLATPAAIRFLSCEPLLGPLDLTAITGPPIDYENAPGRAHWINALTGHHGAWLGTAKVQRPDQLAKVDFAIIGGESGPRSRPFDIAWARGIVTQCKRAGVSAFVKQLGARPVTTDLTHWRCGRELLPDGSGYLLKLNDRKGGDPSEWPTDLRVREFPNG